MDGEKYLLSLVSLNRAKCHMGSRCSTCGEGVGIGACLRCKENALQNVPKNGYVFEGIGPNCSQGKCFGHKDTPYLCAHAWKWVLDNAGTFSGSACATVKGVACWHSRNLCGFGSKPPPLLWGELQNRQGQSQTAYIQCCPADGI